MPQWQRPCTLGIPVNKAGLAATAVQQANAVYTGGFYTGYSLTVG